MIVISAIKKPIEIQAVLFDGSKELMGEISVQYASNVYPEFDGKKGDHWTGKLIIETLEGRMIANPGDYIITGVRGERYPIKGEIFRETYDVVGEKNIVLPKYIKKILEKPKDGHSWRERR